ncbi:MAG: hypothetical protein EBU33_09775, partial [Sphingobacteriia bacterium]|nr:hypothetical protein [Sphingobacteriia bacterium]
MSQFTQFSSIALSERINAVDGIILGVCVMEKGEAKGHNLQIDDKSLDQFLQLASERKDGVKVRFGADHNAGASDINGALKNFRREGDRIRADLHLLKTDKNYSKIIEMAEMLPNEFGLSASTTAGEELIGHDRYVRFTEIFCVDIVSNPAATKGLFFSQNNNNQTNTIRRLTGRDPEMEFNNIQTTNVVKMMGYTYLNGDYILYYIDNNNIFYTIGSLGVDQKPLSDIDP